MGGYATDFWVCVSCLFIEVGECEGDVVVCLFFYDSVYCVAPCFDFAEADVAFPSFFPCVSDAVVEVSVVGVVSPSFACFCFDWWACVVCEFVGEYCPYPPVFVVGDLGGDVYLDAWFGVPVSVFSLCVCPSCAHFVFSACCCDGDFG